MNPLQADWENEWLRQMVGLRSPYRLRLCILSHFVDPSTGGDEFCGCMTETTKGALYRSRFRAGILTVTKVHNMIRKSRTNVSANRQTPQQLATG